jgi:protein tyrosine phosphatase (PTP) superfamily phosphohydrolase (DUF442 family)
MAQQVTRDTIPGINNFARLETTVACAGATSAEAVPEIKKMGFASIINLRLSTERGAEVEKEEAAARAVGLRYFHVPFDGSPDAKAADQFLNAITSKGAEPAFIHCAGGNRAKSAETFLTIVLPAVEEAIKQRNATLLRERMGPLRSTCNSCHKDELVEFIQVGEPQVRTFTALK